MLEWLWGKKRRRTHLYELAIVRTCLSPGNEYDDCCGKDSRKISPYKIWYIHMWADNTATTDPPYIAIKTFDLMYKILP